MIKTEQQQAELSASDVAYHLHQRTNLDRHEAIGPSLIERAEGVYLFGADGSKRIDAMSGLWCMSLGYSQKSIVEVASAQMERLPYCHTFRHQTSEPTTRLASELVRLAPGDMSKVTFHCSGSEANDTAIKMIWCHNNMRGRPRKKKIVARQLGYHGTSISTASITGFPGMFDGFDLPLPGFIHVPAPNFYRRAEDGETELEFSRRAADELESVILENEPDTIAAFFAEPIMAGAGVLLPPAGYFDAVQRVLKKYDILLVADEIVCGFGRTGRMWGCETFGITPDIVTFGKALSAGFFPISGILIKDEIYQSLRAHSQRTGGFSHGYTFGGSPVGAAIALEALRLYHDLDVFKHVQNMAEIVRGQLKSLEQQPLVGETRQSGLAASVVLVPNKDRRKYFPSELMLGDKVQELGWKHGVMLRPVSDDAIVIAPPLIIRPSEIELLFEAIGRTLDDAWGWLATRRSEWS